MKNPGQAVVPEIMAPVSEIIEVVREASRRSLEFFRRPLVVENKREGSTGFGFDPVTEADRMVEDLLSDALQVRFPEVGVYGEERGSTGSDDTRWIIDPIDGTRAFVTGRPMWGTLLGLEVHGQLVAGFMHAPVLDETYWAVAGNSNDSGSITATGSKPLATSDVSKLCDARLASTSPSMFVSSAEKESFERVVEHCQLTRFDGDCYNYALLATGDIDVVVENQLEPYDIAALVPIVEAAGGVITNLTGQAAGSGGFVIASATSALHTEVLELLRRPKVTSSASPLTNCRST